MAKNFLIICIFFTHNKVWIIAIHYCYTLHWATATWLIFELFHEVWRYTGNQGHFGNHPQHSVKSQVRIFEIINFLGGPITLFRAPKTLSSLRNPTFHGVILTDMSLFVNDNIGNNILDWPFSSKNPNNLIAIGIGCILYF